MLAKVSHSDKHHVHYTRRQNSEARFEATDLNTTWKQQGLANGIRAAISKLTESLAKAQPRVFTGLPMRDENAGLRAIIIKNNICLPRHKNDFAFDACA